jgi:type IV pilus biogenesis protein CpaD/CtpE
MRRANELMRAVIVLIVTIPALLAGCTQRDPAGRGTFDSSAVASNDLPEVIIRAHGPRSKTIVLSARDAQSVR